MGASKPRWRPPAPPSPRSMAWVPYWPRGSSGRSATWRDFRPRLASPPTVARHPWRPQAGRWCATGSRWPGIAGSTTPCTWSPYARLGRTFGAEPTTARRWRRASPARRRCGASRGASATPSSGASWQTRKPLRTAPLDKEEPRIPIPRTPVKKGRDQRRTSGPPLILTLPKVGVPFCYSEPSPAYLEGPGVVSAKRIARRIGNAARERRTIFAPRQQIQGRVEHSSSVVIKCRHRSGDRLVRRALVGNDLPIQLERVGVDVVHRLGEGGRDVGRLEDIKRAVVWESRSDPRSDIIDNLVIGNGHVQLVVCRRRNRIIGRRGPRVELTNLDIVGTSLGEFVLQVAIVGPRATRIVVGIETRTCRIVTVSNQNAVTVMQS